MPYSPAFLRICKLFPNKTGRLEAWRVWARLLRDFPEGQLEALCTAAIAWLAKTDQWQRGVVPHLRTWLNGRRFQDEKTPTKARTTGWAGVPDGEYPDGEQKI